MPLSAAVPLSATISTWTDELTVNFSHLLVDGLSAIGNFRLFDGANVWDHPAPAAINMRSVVATMIMGAADPTPPSCQYLAVPPDVVDRNGLPVAAFAGFPVTVVP